MKLIPVYTWNKTLISLGVKRNRFSKQPWAQGVILLACHKNGLPIHEYTPPQVKQAVVGYGKAEKKQVIAMVTSLLNLKSPPKPDDTADALAIALCHGQAAGSAMRDYFNQ